MTSKEGLISIYDKLLEDQDYSSLLSQKENLSPELSREYTLKYQKTVEEINQGIEKYILEEHDELFNEMHKIERIKSSMSHIHHSIDGLFQAIEQIQKSLQQSYLQLENTIHQLDHVHNTSLIVDKVLDFSKTKQKVEKFQQNEKIIPSLVSASLLYDLQEITKQRQCQMIHFIQKESVQIEQWVQLMLQDTEIQFHQGIVSLNQRDIGKAVQIYFAFHQLETKLTERLGSIMQDVETQWHQRLGDVEHDSSIWSVFQELFGTFQKASIQVWNIQRVLIKIKQGRGEACYLDVLSGKCYFTLFYEMLCPILKDTINTFVQKGDQELITKLLQEYPRLRNEGLSLLQRFSTLTNKKVKGDRMLSHIQLHSYKYSKLVQQALRDDVLQNKQEKDMLISIFDAIGLEYRNALYQQLISPIQLMFPTTQEFHHSPPNRSDVQHYIMQLTESIKLMKTEQYDCDLLDNVYYQMNQSIQLFCRKLQESLLSENDDLAIKSPFLKTVTHNHYHQLIDILIQLNDFLVENESYLNKQALIKLLYKLLAPYFQSIALTIEDYIYKMHLHSFHHSSTQSSPFMADLVKVFHIIKKEHLNRFSSSNDVVLHCTVDLYNRLMNCFVRNIAMIRPLNGENGKMALIQDISEFEMVLSELQVSKSHFQMEVHAFKQIVLLETRELLRHNIVDQLRPSLIWMHLITRGPDELQLPHRLKQLTIFEYITWMNNDAGNVADEPMQQDEQQCPLGKSGHMDMDWSLRAEKRIWKDVFNSLEAYMQRNSAKPNVQLSPLYELILDSHAQLLAGYELFCHAEFEA